VTRTVFVGSQAVLAAAVGNGAFAGPEPEEAVLEAIEELEVPVPQHVDAPLPGDRVVDTDEWGLPQPVGLCLEEVRELVAVIELRVSNLPR
jgi:hypothetical protein